MGGLLGGKGDMVKPNPMPAQEPAVTAPAPSVVVPLPTAPAVVQTGITAAQVARCWPTNKEAARWADALNPAFRRFELTKDEHEAAFMAVCAQESGNGARLSESLDYQPHALIATFSAFTPELAQKYGRTADHKADQYWIGEIAYGNRGGNGPPGTGDGYANRGVGLIQQTGKTNLTTAAQYFGMGLSDYRDWQRTPEGAAMGSCFYWKDNRLNRFAEVTSRDSFKKLSAVVNRGSEFKEPKDWDKRLICYERALLAFGLRLR